MPDNLDEVGIDVGDGDERSTEVSVSTDETETETETAEQPIEKNTSKEELEEYSSSVSSRINDLTRRFREEERQKQSAIEYADNVHKENEGLKARLGNLDKGYLQQFAGRVESQVEQAKRLLKEAHEIGDVDQIVEAQETLANLSVERSRVNVAKADAAKADAVAQQQAPPPPQRTAPPRQPPDPKAEKWASQNDWFGNDEVMTYAAFGVHRRLIEDERFDPTSNDYYDELDRRMRQEFPQKFESSSKPNGGRKVASAESSKSRNKGGRKTVRLTPSQVAIAKRLNVPLEEYAKYVRD
eukprot:GHVU01051394.1.p1 GENE.GHVU01051394.1~~GHVU01051394.1.p1  ORF type:complete len:298 (+),score=34.86 GHVU01051394.1:1468-2361(+)